MSWLSGYTVAKSTSVTMEPRLSLIAQHPVQRFFQGACHARTMFNLQIFFSIITTAPLFSSNSTSIHLTVSLSHVQSTLFLLLSYAFLTIPPLSPLVSYFLSLSFHFPPLPFSFSVSLLVFSFVYLQPLFFLFLTLTPARCLLKGLCTCCCVAVCISSLN